jgi:acyl-CoA reductase-like NAD-dependent aldehyde dehydrogenase
MDLVTPLPLAGERFTGAPGSPQPIEVHAPFDGRLVGRVPTCGMDEVRRAVSSACAAFERSDFERHARASVLDRAALALSSRVDEFARLIALEAAKPLRTARVEVERAAGTMAFAAAEARTFTGDMIPLDALPSGVGKLGFAMRVPIGVIGAIAPFNFPLNLVVHKVAPAIAAGCPIVLKPASQTPLTAVRLAELLIDDCGLPADWLHVVTGPGSTVGHALVDHPRVAMVSFTGSPEVGWAIRARAPRKRVGLELGNNAPVIIAADGDWRSAAAKIEVGGFSHAGQSCISTQRIYVHDDVADEFLADLVQRVGQLVVGDPLDERTEVSALISTDERDRVMTWIDEACAGGAQLAAGGVVDDRGVLLPTVLTEVTPEMNVCAREVFGPVVTVNRFRDLDEAFRAANTTDYGLQAAVFTADLATAMRAVRILDFGGVLVNEIPTWRADHQPYGGLRDSGNTREGPAYAVREMTELRMVVLGT